MKFRELTKADMDEVVQLEKQCFASCWGKAELLGEFDLNPFSHGWALVDDDEIVAYAFLWETFEAAQLARIGVKKSKRKSGLGKTLMNRLIRRAHDAGCEFMRLEVRPSNTAGLALYESLGFTTVSRIPEYYSDGEDALVMIRMLEDEE